MFWFQLVVAVALLAAVGWLAVGGGGHMSEPVQDRPDLALPPGALLERSDVDQVRFSVGVRGYRMDEVDDVLDRLAAEIEERERRIAELEGRPYGTDAEAEAQIEVEAQVEAEAEAGQAEPDTAAEAPSDPAAETDTAAEPESAEAQESAAATRPAEDDGDSGAAGQ
jgi:DivIVA domain-containing protein